MTTWTRPCACGSDVTADPDDPTPGVREHNASPSHKAYRRRRVMVERTADYRRRMRADVELVRLRRWASTVASTVSTPYPTGVSGVHVVSNEQVPDNGGVSQPKIEDLDVSLPERAA